MQLNYNQFARGSLTGAEPAENGISFSQMV
jgi:hypothetical protein